MKKISTIELTTGTLARFLLLIVGLAFLFLIRDIVLIILVSIIIASSVEPLIAWFIRYHVPRVIAVLAIYLAGIISAFLVFYLLMPPLFQDFQNFLIGFPGFVDKALLQFQEQFPFIPIDAFLPRLHDFAIDTNINLQEAVSGALTTGSTLFSGIVQLLLIFIISFYLAVQEDGIGMVLRILTPEENEAYVLDLWKRSQRKIGRWLQGQLLLGVIIGVMVYISLTILQVRHAFILAVLSAILEIIPYFGPIIAALPAIAVAALQRPLLGLLVAGIYVIVQQMENHLIYPQVVRKTVGVHPLVAIIAILVGAKLAGAIGVIISVPITVVFMEYVNDVASRKKNIV